jgi:hypothetical protein
VGIETLHALWQEAQAVATARDCLFALCVLFGINSKSHYNASASRQRIAKVSDKMSERKPSKESRHAPYQAISKRIYATRRSASLYNNTKPARTA